MVDRQQAMALLNAMEAQLKSLLLWQSSMPSVEALSSKQPFCCDTLDFEQWLQFVLIPRMTALIEGGHPLPTEIAVAPMAEQAFAGELEECAKLIEYIQQFDRLLSHG